ncbi:MAG: MarR family winged helix-turn-helix transcriptional regulator [Myxococcaceae bacterium]
MRRRWFLEEEDLPSPQDRAANLLGALAVGLNDRILVALEASLELPANSIAVLFAVDSRPGMSIEEIRAPLGLTQTTAARLVAGLVSRGLMLREVHRGDVRSVSLRTSELGRRRVLRAKIARSQLTRGLVERVPWFWIPRLIRMAERLLEALAKDPSTSGQICRFCNRAVCRVDPTAPCPVVLAATTHDCPSSPTVPAQDGGRLYQERRIVDGDDPTVELWLEPGGAAFRLPAGRRLEVLCRGDRHGHVELERLPEGHIALHAWPGATFTVLEAGREIYLEERALSLSMGVGTTTRERVESIYGDFQRRREMSQPRWL